MLIAANQLIVALELDGGASAAFNTHSGFSLLDAVYLYVPQRDVQVFFPSPSIFYISTRPVGVQEENFLLQIIRVVCSLGTIHCR